MIKKYSLLALETALNHALSLDADISTKMGCLEDKTLKVIISPLDVYFFMHIKDGKFHLKEAISYLPDTTIHSTPLGLIRLSLLPASKARSLFNDSIRLTGDVETGQQVKQLFDSLEIDWEGHLARFTGDVIAHQIGSMFRSTKAFTAHFHDSMRKNTTEYVQEELRILPTALELKNFYEDIDALALAVERLAARVRILSESS
jgi:ubiquinone biosynthesis accessory factor UbiJ